MQHLKECIPCQISEIYIAVSYTTLFPAYCFFSYDTSIIFCKILKVANPYVCGATSEYPIESSSYLMFSFFYYYIHF